MHDSSVTRLLRAWRGRQTFNTFCVKCRSRNRLILPATLLLSGLAGCNHAAPGMDVDKNSSAYKYLHAANIEPMKDMLPGVQGTTGEMTSPAAPPLSAPVAVSSDAVLDDPTGLNDAGEKAGSWNGALDIYWKLNWIRQELMAGNVPRQMPDVVARQRRHLTRILREGKHLDPDASYDIPEGVTVPDALAFADSALKQLDAGLEHIQQQKRLEAAGIRTLSVAWNASEAEITRQFAQRGLIKVERPMVTGTQNDDDGSPTATKPLHSLQMMPATRQDEAVALALKYARTYHASPEEMARREFEKALRDIVRMRDLLHYEFHKPSVPGSNAMVPSTLHQEASNPPPTGAPAPVKEMSDPFRSAGDAHQTVVDPFRDSRDAPTKR